MKVYLLRHGQTALNLKRKYQGIGDIPLSPEGEAEIIPARDIFPQTVWVSPLCRARRTAELVFPQATQLVVEDLKEMDFGVFEGRSYKEMKDDPIYRAWLDGGCMDQCPGGEAWADFSGRVCAAFQALVEAALDEGREAMIIMAHGGVQMAVMERFALPKKIWYQWQSPCAGGYIMETDRSFWREERRLRLTDTVEYRKEPTA